MSSPAIFISYRRDDSLPQARGLHQSLEVALGQGNVFYDNSSLKPGMKWPKELEERVRKAQVVLVLYATPKWLGINTDEYGRTTRRIDDPEDWVRKEVETALADEHKLVIPVLINNATLPPEDALPDTINTLGYCQHKQIRETHWEDDLQPLIKILHEKLQSPRDVHPEPAPDRREKNWTSFFNKYPLKPKGRYITVNCDRNREYSTGVYSDFIQYYRQSKNLAFFLSACPYQKPASLAKRLVYELIDDGLTIAYFRDAASDEEVEVIDLKIGIEPEKTWVEFWRVVQKKLFSEEKDPVTLAQSNGCAEKDHIALTFRITEQQWHKPNLEEHIAYILQQFEGLPTTSNKYLLFFIFEFEYVHENRYNQCEQKLQILDLLQIGLNEHCNYIVTSHTKLFPPVPIDEIRKWYLDVALQFTQNSIQELLEILRSLLDEGCRQRTDIDMEYVEEMQQAAYSHILRPQPD